MDSLLNILSYKDFDEPPEIKKLKDYARNNFKADIGVLVKEKDIIISVNSASLANTLRLKGPEIKRVCDINKRLVFKITG
jgi:hypothetical protein